MKVSVFRRDTETIPGGDISISDALKRIKNGKTRELVEKGNKRDLVCVIYQGTFTRRAKDFLSEASGFAVLDWDHMKADDNAEESAIDFRESLKNDEYIYAAWVSPSGKGVKALVKIPKVSSDAEYKEYYNALLVSYPSLDPANKDISRICYESYDPDLWINEDSKLWTQKFESKGSLIDIAYNMIRSAKEGTRHHTILRAGKLMGGYIATGYVDEFDCLDRIEGLIYQIFPEDEVRVEIKAFHDGIEYGKLEPVEPNDYVVRVAKGTEIHDLNDHIAKPDSGWQRIEDYIDGKIERSVRTGVDPIDNHVAIKKNAFYLLTAPKGRGKTVIVLFLMVLAAITGKWRWIVVAQENSIDDLKENLFHYLAHMKVSVAREKYPSLYVETQNYINRYFIFLQNIDTIEQALDVSRHIVTSRPNEDFALLLDPANAFLAGWEWGTTPIDYGNGPKIAMKVLRFSMEYCSVFMTQHTIISAQRMQTSSNTTDSANGEGGWWLNKASYTMGLARETGTNLNYIHTDNVRDKKTGGTETRRDNKLVIDWSPFDVNIYMEMNDRKVWGNVLETIMQNKTFEVNQIEEKVLSLRENDEVPF
jgi:hypothetical protein